MDCVFLHFDFLTLAVHVFVTKPLFAGLEDVQHYCFFNKTIYKNVLKNVYFIPCTSNIVNICHSLLGLHDHV